MKTIHKILLAGLITFAQAITPTLTGRLGGGAALYAQDDNAAFYIYQNDGHFDGFFYDQVQKISYSRLDTLGVEHADYVSQEIVTADSTYRIMLAAIDSVGFVQPEVKFNPKMRNLRTEGMNVYLVQKDADALTLTFSSGMPDALRPHEGDVLIDFDLEDGFGGKVRSVTTSGGSIQVVCDPLESFADVFQQFVTVEQIDKNSHGQLVRRRTAGLPATDIDNRAMLHAPFKAEDNFDFPLFSFGFSGKYTIYDENDLSAVLAGNVNVATSVKGAYRFGYTGSYYIGLTFQSDVDMGLGISFDGKVGEMKERKTPVGAALPIPAAAPIFELTSIPGFFLRGEAHVALAADLVKFKKRIWHKLEFNNDWLPTFNFGNQPLPELDKEIDNAWERDASLSWSGFVQAGVHMPLELGVNRWLKSWIDASFGIHLYAGPKLSGELNVSFSNVAHDGWNPSVYNIYKDTKLALSPLSFDYEAKAVTSTFFSGTKEVTVADGSLNLFDDFAIYLFPEFEISNINVVKTDPKTATVNATLTPSRNIIIPATVGMALFDENNTLVDYKFCDSYSPRPHESIELGNYSLFNSTWAQVKSVTATLKPLAGGKHVIRPIFRQLGINFIASPSEPVDIDALYLRVPIQTLIMPSKKETKTIDISSNYQNVGVLANSGGLSYFDASIEDNKLRITPHHELKGFDRVFDDFYVQGTTTDNGTDYTDNVAMHLLQFGDGEFNKAKFRNWVSLTPPAFSCSTTVKGKDSYVTGTAGVASEYDLYGMEWVGDKYTLAATIHRELDSTLVGYVPSYRKYQELTASGVTLSSEHRRTIPDNGFSHRDYHTDRFPAGQDKSAQYYVLKKLVVVDNEFPASYANSFASSVNVACESDKLTEYVEELTVYFSDGTTDRKTWNYLESNENPFRLTLQYDYE